MNAICKMIRNTLLMLLVIAILPIEAQGYELSKIPEKIKVGIRYGQSATPIVSLYAKSGLSLGYDMGNEFAGVMDFLGNEGIFVRKDSFFMKLNGSFIAYEFDEQNDRGNENIFGPFHIQIGSSFDSREGAERFLASISGLNETPYIAYDKEWKVWIGLYTSLEDAQTQVDAYQNVMPDQPLTVVPPNNKRVQIVDPSGEVLLIYNTLDKEYYFRSMPAKDSLDIIELDGKSFRGNFVVNRMDGSDLTIINLVDLEEYLYGVVPREMSGKWPIEALKAQAVAARNYAVVNIKKHQNYGFDVCATTDCQVYGGYSSEAENSTKAVQATRGKLLTYGGKPITAFYHSNSGGHTENSENIWSAILGYVKGVDDPYSIGNPNDTWSIAYTNQQIEDILASKESYVGKLLSIKITERSEYGRVLQMEIHGTEGKKIFKKEQIRGLFGYNNIKSTWFDIKNDGAVMILSSSGNLKQTTNMADGFVVTSDGTKPINTNGALYIYNGLANTPINNQSSAYVFSGKGWGHGLGMSQWGAKAMAEQGFGFEEILTHYYTGTKIE